MQKQIVNAVVFGTGLTVDTKKLSRSPRLLPLECSITIPGVSGLFQGNSLKIASIKFGGVMPDRYDRHIVWQITQVNHSISDAGWKTSLKLMMRTNPEPPSLMQEVEISNVSAEALEQELKDYGLASGDKWQGPEWAAPKPHPYFLTEKPGAQ